MNGVPWGTTECEGDDEVGRGVAGQERMGRRWEGGGREVSMRECNEGGEG